MVCIVLMTAVDVGDDGFDVLVVGGNGRVGASTLRWFDRLLRRRSVVSGLPRLAVGGRSFETFQKTQDRLSLSNLAFLPVDLEGGSQALIRAVERAKLVVHTAGPFQGRSAPDLLRACIAAGVPYCDVCDEFALSRNGKALSAEARAAGVPAVLSCGIWPGVSALMAALAVEQLGGSEVCDRVELSFHTAGSGGAGPTIVSATFLLLASQVITIADHLIVPKEPWSDCRIVDFGGRIGRRPCFLLDNPDVPTISEAFGIANCTSRFGTSPALWNRLFGLIRALPRTWLNNRSAMQKFAVLSMPVIRWVDGMVGATNAMRVDAYRNQADGRSPELVTLRCMHAQLDDCVGQATAAFGLELLRGRGRSACGEATIEPGVWYPAELPAAIRSNILSVVKENALVWQM